MSKCRNCNVESNANQENVPLCVDLDGTLVRSDLLLESILSLVGRSFFNVFRLPLWLLRGRAHLKEQIASRTTVNPAVLPYNKELLDYLRAKRSEGVRLVLTTASHKIQAERVANHLGLFQQVEATESGVNLKGKQKRDRLVSIFGEGGFDYVGNDYSDLPVWSAARESILVNATNDVARKADLIGNVRLKLCAEKPRFADYLRALRPHQWSKNVLILVPALLDYRNGTVDTVVACLLALICFSLSALPQFTSLMICLT